MRLLLIVFFTLFTLNAEVLFKENFQSLKNWEPLLFDNIENHSTYKINNSILEAQSQNSASGIKFIKNYDIRKFPILTFKWKIKDVYEKGDATTKEGDDYAIRIYVMFKYNPDNASFFEAIKYDFAKSIYGEYPPHSTINYIWSNKIHEKNIITSAYTDRSKMIVLNSGKKDLNRWQTHKVDVLEDYKKAFKKNPPNQVTLAIMTDSDNTGESSLAFIDFIEVSSE